MARKASTPLAGLSAILILTACGPPTLNSVEPGDGYPRQLLSVDGDTFLAAVVWDVGLPTETTLPAGFLGTRYFQIPAGASAGTHPVALRNNDGTSASVNVDVLASSGTFPAPRIEDIGVYSATAASGGLIDVVLTVAAANLDVEAAVTVDGTALSPALFWGGLPIDYQQDHTPATFAYPVYHYGQIIGGLNGATLGTTLNVQVTNTDGQTATAQYTLPSSLALLDGDGDGLLDEWEANGYPGPSGATIDLAALGADQRKIDILVEADWVAAAAPQAGIWATIVTAFDDAPVLSPNGTAGVNMIIDRGQGGAFTGGGTVLTDHTTMDFEPVTATSPAGYASFFDYKGTAANFDPDRLQLFHYAIFGRARPNGSSGRGEIWGNDFEITFVNFSVWANAIAQVGTFIHELGHNLALRHGGIDNGAVDANQTYKPNQASTMNYRYQFPGVSIDCDFATEGVHTYSSGTFATINESNVNEGIGICDNQSLDLNGNGTITNSGPLNTNQRPAGCTCGTGGCDCDTTDVHVDYDEWGNILLNFRAAGSRWNGN